VKSASQDYYLGLDHIRAVAAYLVFCWHFLHTTNGSPVPFGQAELIPPISWINEGHLGVSVFMTLSGYLFAKILDERSVKYVSFYINRFLRLAPLMIFVVFLNALMREWHGQPSVWYFFASLANGLVYPSLPNACWSITVEFHFYLLLPFLLWFSRNSNFRLLILVAMAMAYRLYLYSSDGSVQYVAYWTIIGRIDLFIMGLLGYRYGKYLNSSTTIISVAFIGLAILYAFINHLGGYKGTAQSSIWVCFSTLEAICLAPMIAYYDRLSIGFNGRVSNIVANIGKYSYSMYLLHSFIVFSAATYIHNNIIDLSNVYLAIVVASLVFLLCVPVAYLSYSLIEKPFLRFRVIYLK